MDTPAPRLSIGMPVYNGERYLAQTLDAHLAQTFGDFELIISDNGSTDATESICRGYAAKDARIRYERHSANRGATWNFNRVFDLARGAYFKWSAYDDLIEPTFLAHCVAELDADSTAVLCHTRARIIDGDDRMTGSKPNAQHVTGSAASRFGAAIVQVPFEATFGVIRRDVLVRTGLIGNYANCDIVLICELALHGKLIEVPEWLMLSRDHPTNSIRSARSPSDRAGWFDPKLAGRVVFPICREACEYMRAIRRARLPLGERIVCYGHVLRWVRWNAGRLMLDVLRGMRMMFDRRRVQTA